MGKVFDAAEGIPRPLTVTWLSRLTLTIAGIIQSQNIPLLKAVGLFCTEKCTM